MERTSREDSGARPEWFDRRRPRAKDELPPRRLPSGSDPTWHERVGERQQPKGGTTHRLFIAITLPASTIDEIASLIESMPTMADKNVRWTPRENVHITLLFLGDTSVHLIPRIKEQLTEAAENTAPFTLRLDQPGAFPSLHAPRILWVGLKGEVHKLMQMQGRIEGTMRSIQFEPERRPFTPHITIGRTVHDLEPQYAGDVGFSWRRSPAPPVLTPFTVGEVHLLRSRLQSGGASYEKVFSAKLGG